MVTSRSNSPVKVSSSPRISSNPLVVEIDSHPARHDPVHHEAMAEQPMVGADEALLQGMELEEEKGKGDVVADGADIAQMVGDPLPSPA